MGLTHNPAAVIAKVLGRFKNNGGEHVGYRRAVLVLEPGLAPLAPVLNDAQFLVIVPETMGTFELRRELLSERLLITRNAASFLDDASVLGTGIIGLDALADEIYVGPTLPESATAVMISKAFIDFDLRLERGAYLLLLHPKRRHVFRRLS